MASHFLPSYRRKRHRDKNEKDGEAFSCWVWNAIPWQLNLPCGESEREVDDRGPCTNRSCTPSWRVHRPPHAHRPRQCQHPLSKTIYPIHPISTPSPPPSSNNHNSRGNFSKIDSTSETSIPPSTSPFPPSLFTPPI